MREDDCNRGCRERERERKLSESSVGCRERIVDQVDEGSEECRERHERISEKIGVRKVEWKDY